MYFYYLLPDFSVFFFTIVIQLEQCRRMGEAQGFRFNTPIFLLLKQIVSLQYALISANYKTASQQRFSHSILLILCSSHTTQLCPNLQGFRQSSRCLGHSCSCCCLTLLLGFSYSLRDPYYTYWPSDQKILYIQNHVYYK